MTRGVSNTITVNGRGIDSVAFESTEVRVIDMIYVSERESRIADHCSDGRPFVREVSGLSAVAYRGLSIASSK